MTNFTDLGLDAPLLKALAAENYAAPTPIQAQAIPHILAGKDLLGIAQTGTGKTAAFALPILQRLARDNRPAQRRGCRTLVLSPTRELASQIADSFRAYGKFLRMSVDVIFGGVPLARQARGLAPGTDIIVATPGRLLDLVNQGALRLDGVEILVLDEADQMLDMGFIHDIRRIVKQVPEARQSLFFSATMPGEIAKLTKEMLRDPERVSVAPAATTVERVEQRVIHVDAGAKQALLAHLLADDTIGRALVFSRTKHGADRIVKRLAEAGHPADAIHGNKSQPQRERALAAFRDGRSRVLVATDIAARGIDVEGVTHVVNFDLPNVPESYVHRIGRTARAGASGLAISFCDGEERAYLRDIERLTRQAVPVMENPLGSTPTRTYSDPAPRPAQNRRGRPGGAGPARNDRRDEAPRPAAGPARPAGSANRSQPRKSSRPAGGAGANAPRRAEGGDGLGWLRRDRPAR